MAGRTSRRKPTPFHRRLRLAVKRLYASQLATMSSGFHIVKRKSGRCSHVALSAVARSGDESPHRSRLAAIRKPAHRHSNPRGGFLPSRGECRLGGRTGPIGIKSRAARNRHKHPTRREVSVPLSLGGWNSNSHAIHAVWEVLVDAPPTLGLNYLAYHSCI